MNNIVKSLLVAIAIITISFPAQAEQLKAYAAVFGGADWTKGLNPHRSAAFTGGPEIGIDFSFSDIFVGGAFGYRFGGPSQESTPITIIDGPKKTVSVEYFDASAIGTLSMKLGIKLGDHLAIYVEGGRAWGGDHKIVTTITGDTKDPTSTLATFDEPKWFVGQGFMVGIDNRWNIGIRGRYFPGVKDATADVVLAYNL